MLSLVHLTSINFGIVIEYNSISGISSSKFRVMIRTVIRSWSADHNFFAHSNYKKAVFKKNPSNVYWFFSPLEPTKESQSQSWFECCRVVTFLWPRLSVQKRSCYTAVSLASYAWGGGGAAALSFNFYCPSPRRTITLNVVKSRSESFSSN